MAQVGITVTSNADQAVPGLNRLIASSEGAERAAKRLGATNDNLGKSFDRLKQQADAATAMIQRIDRMTGVTGGVKRAAADIEAYGNELDRLRAKYNPAFAASQAYGRELEGINYAHRVGAISTAEQAAAVAALDARYRSAAASADMLQAATVRAQGATGGQRANALNLGFQAQDIAMMTLMGQAPGMLALQQGMQVGGIFSQMGNGRAIVQGLGSALGMLLNPLNLATIATIGLGAAGVQAFMGMVNGADEASLALEDHAAEIDRILKGYDQAKDARDAFLEANTRTPEAATASNLSREADDARERLDKLVSDARSTIADWRTELDMMVNAGGDAAITSGINAVLETFDKANISASTTKREFDAFIDSMTLLKNAATDPDVEWLADFFLKLGEEARNAQAEIGGVQTAIGQITKDVLVRINVQMEGYAEAQQALRDLMPDFRSRFDQDRDAATAAYRKQLAAATDGILREQAQNDLNAVMAAIDRQESEWNARQNARSGAKTTPIDRWGSANDNFMQRIEQQRMEIDLLGKSTFEVERQRAAFDLLNQAKQAEVQITEPLIQQINQMSGEYANLVVEMEQAVQAQALLDEQLNFYRSTFTGFFGDLKSGLQDGQTMWEALGNAGANALDKIADRALSMAANGLFDMIFGAVMGGFGGNSLGGGWGVAGGFGRPGIFGIPGMATGGTVARSGLSWVGEQGPELLRLPAGAEIIPNAPSMAMVANQNGGDIVINNIINVPPGTSADVAPAIAREVTKELRRQLPDAIERHNRNPLRRAG